MVADYPLQERRSRSSYRSRHTFYQAKSPGQLWQKWLTNMSKNKRLPAHQKFTAPPCILVVFPHLRSQKVLIQNGIVRSADTKDFLAKLV